MTARPDIAMVLAAGLGKRLRPLTDHCPKPMVEINGKSLLNRILDRLESAGVSRVVINTHHLGAMIREHLASRQSPAIRFSDEDVLLETGGGVARALAHLGADSFYVINGDVLWRDGGRPALDRLASFWRHKDMDALLLLQPCSQATGYEGKGDYFCAADGLLCRRSGEDSAPFVFTGIQILHPRLFAGTTIEPFSLNRLYDKAQAAGRLFGLVHDGEWFHISTMEGFNNINRLFAAQGDGA